MRISDWSSDVCSSDLLRHDARHDRAVGRVIAEQPEAQPFAERAAIRFHTLPHAGEDDALAPRVEVLNVRNALGVAFPVKLAQGGQRLRDQGRARPPLNLHKTHPELTSTVEGKMVSD